MYDFARRPRWVVFHVIVLVVVGLFGLAGVWQLQRLVERREHNTFVMRQRSRPVASIGDVFDRPDDAEQRQVRASGRYDTGREVVLRGRSDRGRPGNHVLTPLVMSGGRAVIVDRGWVPFELDRPPVVDALPPEGTVEVTGVALPTEGGPPLTRAASDDSAPRVLSRIDVGRLSRSLPYETFPMYVVLSQQQPEQSGELPDPVTLPGLDEGPHLLYAIQWFAFIAIALVGYTTLLRRESRRQTTT